MRMSKEEFDQYVLLLGQLVNTGRIVGPIIRQWLTDNGATDEELAALDAALSTAIEARRAEHGIG